MDPGSHSSLPGQPLLTGWTDAPGTTLGFRAPFEGHVHPILKGKGRGPDLMPDLNRKCRHAAVPQLITAVFRSRLYTFHSYSSGPSVHYLGGLPRRL